MSKNYDVRLQVIEVEDGKEVVIEQIQLCYEFNNYDATHGFFVDVLGYMDKTRGLYRWFDNKLMKRELL